DRGGQEGRARPSPALARAPLRDLSLPSVRLLRRVAPRNDGKGLSLRAKRSNPPPASRVRVRILLAAGICALIAGCTLPPLTGDLKSAREACNRDYPRRIGNYLPHAQCVNAAIEAYALPTAPHPAWVPMLEA